VLLPITGRVRLAERPAVIERRAHSSVFVSWPGSPHSRQPARLAYLLGAPRQREPDNWVSRSIGRAGFDLATEGLDADVFDGTGWIVTRAIRRRYVNSIELNEQRPPARRRPALSTQEACERYRRLELVEPATSQIHFLLLSRRGRWSVQHRFLLTVFAVAIHPDVRDKFLTPDHRPSGSLPHPGSIAPLTRRFYFIVVLPRYLLQAFGLSFEVFGLLPLCDPFLPQVMAGATTLVLSVNRFAAIRANLVAKPSDALSAHGVVVLGWPYPAFNAIDRPTISALMLH